MPKAKSAAESAVSLNPELAEAHVVLGLVASKYEWNLENARREFDTAVKCNPMLASAHLYFGLFLAQQAKFDEALKELTIALQADPLDLDIESYTGTVLYWARRGKQAEASCRRSVELNPLVFADHLCLGWALQSEGRFSEAEEAFNKARELNNTALTRLELARAQKMAGESYDVIAQQISKSLRMRPQHFSHQWETSSIKSDAAKRLSTESGVDELHQSRSATGFVAQ